MRFLRTLLTRRWLGALVVAVAVSLTTYRLGLWQWHRHEAKSTRAHLVETNYHADPVTLDTAFPGGALDPSRQWVPVRVSGSYDATRRLLVRNRPNNGAYGFEVLVPLRVAGGRAVLVDRGWLPFGDDARSVPSVPGEFSGPVTVVGWARPGEHAVSEAGERGQLTAIDVPQARARTGLRLVDGYLVLREEARPTADTPSRPAALSEPSTDKGPHFAYALQWWGGMVLAPLLVLWGALREAREGDPVAGPSRPGRRRRHLWTTDEEEDEEVDARG